MIVLMKKKKWMEKKMTTNLERIRQMTADELAGYYVNNKSRCNFCILPNPEICELSCKEGIKQWLEQEVEEDESK